MRRALFASLLLLLLLAAPAPPAFARQKGLEFRTGDALRGLVREARIEHATFSREDGRLVEGPRRLSAVVSYTPDGKTRDYQGYAPDGSPGRRYVEVFDDAGNLVDKSIFDGKGRLLDRTLYRRTPAEALTFNADGSLRERVLTVWDENPRRIAEVQVYDGRGALVKRSVNTREDGRSVWKTYRPDGSLAQQAVYSLDYGGPHRSEERAYTPDGALARRRVSDSDAGSQDLRAAEERGDGGPPRRTREQREYDERGNLLKLTNFKWNAETRQYEPLGVSYYALTYYR